MPPFLMSNTVINIKGYEQAVKDINAIQRSQLKFVVSKSLNELGYWLRKNEQREMDMSFKDPVPFTINAPLYTKSDKSNLQITFFLRDQAGKGTPPAVYLYPQVEGGPVYVTGFTRKLRTAGLIKDQEYAAHWAGPSLQRLTGGRLNQILFSVGASGPTVGKYGPPTSRQSRSQGKYFILGQKDPRKLMNDRGRSAELKGRYRVKREDGFTGKGIYTRQGGQLELVIPIYPYPFEVKNPRYDWKAGRIQGLADKQFSTFFAGNLSQL